MKKSRLLSLYFTVLFCSGIGTNLLKGQALDPGNEKKEKEYQVGVYYFPQYHPDKRNEKYFGRKWSEWELVKAAAPKFQGHQQPKKPLWGYTDESNPKHMAKKIQAAASHGIDAFIFDWYYYNDGLFLEAGLEKGFMKAKNNKLLKFGLMWANHNWTDVFPFTEKKGVPWPGRLLYPGKITLQKWDKMTDYIISKYFKHPSYWVIDGSPYFSIFYLKEFIEMFETIEEAAKGLENFRQKTKSAGFRDLNVNAVVWGDIDLPDSSNGKDSNNVVQALGFNSATSYVWVHHVPLHDYPAVNNYDSARLKYFDFASTITSKLSVPYYPNVSMGWDTSPRYPDNNTPAVITGNTPLAFKNALTDAKKFMDTYLKGSKVMTINSWNEWTEGSYIEPDKTTGMQYLEAVKEVFGRLP